MRLLIGNQPQVTPTVGYSPAISSKEIKDLDDGAWYFHVRLGNQSGWGSVSHFRVQIDTKDPEYFNLKNISEDDSTSPFRRFELDALDTGSGIDHYSIQIDAGEAINFKDKIYKTPILAPGKHTIIAKAFDGAGNYLIASEEFTIDPIDTPTITDYPKELTNNDKLIINGTSYPEAKVIVSLQYEAMEAQSYQVKADQSGNFIFVLEERLKDGVYKLKVQAEDDRGAISDETEEFKILVEPTKLVAWGTITVGVLSVIIPIIALIFLLIFVIWFAWLRFKSIHHRVMRETNEAEQILHKEFLLLKRKITKRVKDSSRGGVMTAKDKQALELLKQEFNDSEDRIMKEIRDIKKEMR